MQNERYHNCPGCGEVEPEPKGNIDAFRCMQCRYVIELEEIRMEEQERFYRCSKCRSLEVAPCRKCDFMKCSKCDNLIAMPSEEPKAPGPEPQEPSSRTQTESQDPDSRKTEVDGYVLWDWYNCRAHPKLDVTRLFPWIEREVEHIFPDVSVARWSLTMQYKDPADPKYQMERKYLDVLKDQQKWQFQKDEKALDETLHKLIKTSRGKTPVVVLITTDHDYAQKVDLLVMEKAHVLLIQTSSGSSPQQRLESKAEVRSWTEVQNRLRFRHELPMNSGRCAFYKYHEMSNLDTAKVYVEVYVTEGVIRLNNNPPDDPWVSGDAVDLEKLRATEILGRLVDSSCQITKVRPFSFAELVPSIKHFGAFSWDRVSSAYPTVLETDKEVTVRELSGWTISHVFAMVKSELLESLSVWGESRFGIAILRDFYLHVAGEDSESVAQIMHLIQDTSTLKPCQAVWWVPQTVHRALERDWREGADSGLLKSLQRRFAVVVQVVFPGLPVQIKKDDRFVVGIVKSPCVGPKWKNCWNVDVEGRVEEVHESCILIDHDMLRTVDMNRSPLRPLMVFGFDLKCSNFTLADARVALHDTVRTHQSFEEFVPAQRTGPARSPQRHKYQCETFCQLVVESGAAIKAEWNCQVSSQRKGVIRVAGNVDDMTSLITTLHEWWLLFEEEFVEIGGEPDRLAEIARKLPPSLNPPIHFFVEAKPPSKPSEWFRTNLIRPTEHLPEYTRRITIAGVNSSQVKEAYAKILNENFQLALAIWPDLDSGWQPVTKSPNRHQVNERCRFDGECSNPTCRFVHTPRFDLSEQEDQPTSNRPPCSACQNGRTCDRADPSYYHATVPCRRWMRGSCHLGNQCTFRHGDLPKPFLPRDTPVCKRCQQGLECNRKNYDEYHPTIDCRHHQIKGRCQLGDQCKFIHRSTHRK